MFFNKWLQCAVTLKGGANFVVSAEGCCLYDCSEFLF